MSEPAKIKKWTVAAPVTIVDDEGNPMWFHPPCGVGHPFVDGEAVCPVYAEANRVLAEVYETLKGTQASTDDAAS